MKDIIVILIPIFTATMIMIFGIYRIEQRLDKILGKLEDSPKGEK